MGYPSGVHNSHPSLIVVVRLSTIGSGDKAVDLLDSLVTTPTFAELLTIPGLRYLHYGVVV